jgi:hypothetical protein
MNKAHKVNDPKCDIPSSESFRVENNIVSMNGFKNAQAKLANPASSLHEHVGFLGRPKPVGSTHNKCLGQSSNNDKIIVI